MTIKNNISIFLVLLLTTASTYSLYQDGHYFPDIIRIENTSDQSIFVEDQEITCNSCHDFYASEKGYLLLHHGQTVYRLSYPVIDPNKRAGEVSVTMPFDFATLQWYADAHTKKIPVDQVCFTNDTLYKIAVVYALNKVRSPARIAHPNETVSKVVRSEKPTRSAEHCTVLIKYLEDSTSATIKVSVNTDNADAWKSITLSAATIKSLSQGYTIEVV